MGSDWFRRGNVDKSLSDPDIPQPELAGEFFMIMGTKPQIGNLPKLLVRSLASL